MQQDQMRQLVSSAVQQSLAESGIVITAIPSAQLQALVNALADGVFSALSAMEEESDKSSAANMAQASQSLIPPPANPAPAPVEERMLWRGRPYLTIGTVYELTTQRFRILRGILGNQIEEIELVRVRDTKVKQHVGERLLDVGDITIYSADQSMPEIVLNNVRNPVEVRELIRKAVQVERQRRGLVYREIMEDSEHDGPH
jgi:hypothetical protein